MRSYQRIRVSSPPDGPDIDIAVDGEDDDARDDNTALLLRGIVAAGLLSVLVLTECAPQDRASWIGLRSMRTCR